MMKNFTQPEKNIPESKQSDIQAPNTTNNIASKQIWYVILFIYAILLIFTGGVTFFYNNGFSSRDENIKKLELMKTTAQFTVYKRFLKMETENMRSINNVANQSFNVVLGSLLGFLSASLTTVKSPETELLENQDLETESDLEDPNHLNLKSPETELLEARDLKNKSDAEDSKN